MKERIINTMAIAAILLAAILMSGCAQMFTAKTTATYRILPDGTKEISYSSDKEQVGLKVNLEESAGKVQSLKISVDKASTQEEIIAATLQNQSELLKLIQMLATSAPK
jgi:ABC-type glycerol-3-phosphate transport system substrate-binding protein